MNPNRHKPFLSFEQQYARISEYGIVVGSLEDVMADLRRLGYYRLSGYWYPFRMKSEQPDDPPRRQVYPGISFTDVVAMCDFDAQLRSIILEAISSVEIAIRVAIAHQLGQYGAMTYLTPAAWNDGCTIRGTTASGEELPSPLERFCLRHVEMLGRAHEDFVVHFNERYNGEVPVWAAIELWDFGTTSRAFRMLRPQDRTHVASQIGISHKVLSSWLVAVNDLRNFCAHHGRLSRRVFVNKPKIPRSATLPQFDHIPAPKPGDKVRLYHLLCVLSFMLKAVAPRQRWQEHIVQHFAQIDQIHGVRLDNYGIPDAWTNETLWRNG